MYSKQGNIRSKFIGDYLGIFQDLYTGDDYNIEIDFIKDA
jgi:hypothetical protein